jgi:hypothetical protein
MLTWVVARHLGEISAHQDPTGGALELYADWHLRSTLVDTVMAFGRGEDIGQRAAETVALMIDLIDWRSPQSGLERIGLALSEAIGSAAGQRFLGVNRHADVLWFNREAFEDLLRWLMFAWILDDIVEDSESAPRTIAATAAVWEVLHAAAEASSFRLVEFLETLQTANSCTARDE